MRYVVLSRGTTAVLQVPKNFSFKNVQKKINHDYAISQKMKALKFNSFNLIFSIDNAEKMMSAFFRNKGSKSIIGPCVPS